MRSTRTPIDEPNMSDTTILMKLEDLINIAMGPANKNTVNYKLIQAILHILARQMRMLETNVELRLQEMRDTSPERRKSPRKKTHGHSSDEASSKKKEKAEKSRDKADKEGTAKDGTKSEKTKEKVGEYGADKKEKGKGSSRTEEHKQLDKDELREGSSSSRDREDISATSIEITEKMRGKDKVLVVEKAGPPDIKTKVGSIEVVTQSQFEQLEAAIKELKSIAGPIPIPELPDNQKLRSDLAKGSASLSDTMQAMQVTARLKAAEEAISRMAGLLSALSAAGALPEGFLEKFATRFDEDAMSMKPQTPGKSVAIDKTIEETGSPSRKSLGAKSTLAASKVSRPSVASRRSTMSTGAVALVTQKEMNDALLQLKEDVTKTMNNMAAKSTNAVDAAINTTKAISDRMDIALKLNTRISTLNSMVADYAEQLSGFDAGLATQVTQPSLYDQR